MNTQGGSDRLASTQAACLCLFVNLVLVPYTYGTPQDTFMQHVGALQASLTTE